MSRNNILSFAPVLANCPPIGGQAVMEGVMMRNGDVYGLAVRAPGGEIRALRLSWVSITNQPWLRVPFIRGFPILLETMINGIHALNHSVTLGGQQASQQNGAWQTALCIAVAALMAVALFVLAPHLLSLLMLPLGLGGDVDGLTFHLWDGFYKCLIFVAYIWLISFIPDIRRVFQYHGAEHKIIHAYESLPEVSAENACRMSRLHPRCGTTFLLFVICLSIVLQAILVPLLLKLWMTQSMLAKHALSLIFKILLIVPISAFAYELIRFVARLPEGFFANILLAPGLALQKLTTCEPSGPQLEVAAVALAEALDAEDGAVKTVPYARADSV